MARDRKGAQLSFELPPELFERLRAHAAAERRTMAGLLRRWIEAGLAGALEPSTEPSAALVGLANRVETLEREVAQLQAGALRVPRRDRVAPPSPDRVIPAQPGEHAPLPERRLTPDEAVGLLTTPEVSQALGLASDSAITNWIRRQTAKRGGSAVGATYRGHRLRGMAQLPGASRPGWLWEPV